MEHSDDEYFIPQGNQKIYGAGIKRKRIKFVPASAPGGDQLVDPRPNDTSVGDAYLALVMNDDSKGETRARRSSEESDGNASSLKYCLETPVHHSFAMEEAPERGFKSSSANARATAGDAPQPFQSALVDQIDMEHAHPPLNVDRTGSGFRYLSSYGWDPDSRRGLGATGDGPLMPIKQSLKNDTLGVGARTELEDRRRRQATTNARKDPTIGREKLDAGKMRSLAIADRKNDEALRELIWGDDRVAKYLGRE